MSLEALRSLDAATLRSLVPAFISGYIADDATAAINRERVRTALASLSDGELVGLIEALVHIGDEPRMYVANPGARVMSRAWCRDVFTDGEVRGLDHLRAAADAGPTLILCNHLSYLDTQATDALLAWAGAPDLADRVVAVAGPKVYSDLFRRFAAACLNTLPAPQSAAVASETLGPRELARRALETLRLGHEAMAAGHLVLLYAEGSRTRTGRLRPFLRAVHRYLDMPGLRIVPAAIVGTDRIMPIDDERLHPGPVSITFGAPFEVAAAGGAREALERGHAAVAGLLPPERRPDPADTALA